MPTSPPITPYCPSPSTSFYICTDTPNHFIGCCATNPCSTAGICPPNDIAPTSFDPAAYGTFPAQDCDAGAQFYTCKYGGTRAPFMGCCKADPCGEGGGCVGGDLVGMKLSGERGRAEAFLDGAGFAVLSGSTLVPSAAAAATGSLATTVSMTTGGSSLTVPFRSATGTGRPSGMSSVVKSSASPTLAGAVGEKVAISRGTVAGISVASIALAFGLFGIVFFLLCRRNRRRRTMVLPFKQRSSIDAPTTRDGGSSGRDGFGEAVEAYPDLPSMKERQMAGSAASGTLVPANPFGDGGRLESGASNYRDNEYSNRSSRHYVSPNVSPIPPARAVMRDAPRHSPKMSQSTTRSNRPSIPLFYAHQQLQTNNNNSRNSASSSSYVRDSQRMSQAPTIPSRHSSQNFSYPNPQHQPQPQPQPQSPIRQQPKPTKIPILITPSTNSSPPRAYINHSRNIPSNILQYATTIRPVSLEPLYEYDQQRTTQPTRSPNPPNTRYYSNQEPTSHRSPTMSELDAVFGVTPIATDGRVSPLNPPNRAKSPTYATFGTVSVSSPQQIREMQTQNTKQRLSGVGVTRFSEASGTSQMDDGKRGSMLIQPEMLSGGNANWARDREGKWYRQGVGSLPG